MASNPSWLETGWRRGVLGGRVGLAPLPWPGQAWIIFIEKNVVVVQTSTGTKQN